MSKISKEVKIGMAFIVAILLLYYGISFLKGFNLFKPSNTYMVVFEDVSGLTMSSPVTLNGFQVGLVSSMELDPKNPKHVITYVNMDKGVKIPVGSKMKLDVSVLGSATIIMETNPYTQEYVSPTDTIIGIRNKGLMDAAGGMLPQVSELLPKVDSILTGINALVNNPALAQSLADVNRITADMSKSAQQLNIMMQSLNKDLPEISGNLNKITKDVSGLSGQLEQVDISSTYKSIDATVKNMEALSNKLNSRDNSLGLLMNDRQLFDSITSTLNNASLLLKDVKENPSRYINVRVF